MEGVSAGRRGLRRLQPILEFQAANAREFVGIARDKREAMDSTDRGDL
jgi:hypothetical protein